MRGHESFGGNAEQGEALHESESEQSDYPEFAGRKIHETVAPTISEEDAKAAVLEAISKKRDAGEDVKEGAEEDAEKTEMSYQMLSELAERNNKIIEKRQYREDAPKVDTSEVVVVMTQEIEALKKEVPEDMKDVDGWIDALDGGVAQAYEKYLYSIPPEDTMNLATTHKEMDEAKRISSFDWKNMRDLSERYGADLPSGTRAHAYEVTLKSVEAQGSTVAVEGLLTQARQNLKGVSQKIEGTSGNRREDLEQSKMTEQKVIKELERIGIEKSPDLTEVEKRDALRTLQEQKNLLNGLVNAIEQQKQVTNERDRKKLQKEIDEYASRNGISATNNLGIRAEAKRRLLKVEEYNDDNDKFFEDEKARKFLFTQADEEKGKVSGFGNRRKLNRAENALPDTWEEAKKQPFNYSKDKLSELATQYAEM